MGAIIGIIIFILILRAILNTEAGAILLLVFPILFLTLNFCIGWENYWDGVPFPNPVDPTGFIYDAVAKIFGRAIDQAIGVSLFEPILGWIVGAFFYVGILMGFQMIVYNKFFASLDTKVSAVLYFIFLIIFTMFYYFHMFDNFLFLGAISMPECANSNIKSYYWVSLVLAYLFNVDIRNI